MNPIENDVWMAEFKVEKQGFIPTTLKAGWIMP